ncbi:MAG: basic amino acid/polyamine antiporter [Clostridium sp.]
MENNEKKLGLFGLVFLIIGAMIGGGLFSLPSQLAENAGTFAIIIGWIVAGIGVFALAFVYQLLSDKKPLLTGGLFSYAKEGFGSYIGFNSAWIYWLSSIFGDVAYATLIFGSLSYFFNIFNPAGNNWPSIIGGSIIIWVVNFLVLRGVKQAVIVNAIVTISKIIPIILFIIVCIIFFHLKNFTFQFFGTPSLGGTYTQVKNTMIATLWSFVGIEGAVVVSGRAKSQKDVGRATIIGLASALAIYVLISLLALGVMKRPDLANLNNPSLAYILQAAIGKWGAIIINIGLIVALTGALLGWTVITAEMPYVASQSRTLPKILSRDNKYGAPGPSLWLTTIVTQLLLLFAHFSNNGYQLLYTIASTAISIPYFLSALYAFKVSFIKKEKEFTTRDKIVSIVATIYTLWIIYAAGVKYILLNCILFSIGLIFYVWAKKENKEKVFEKWYEILIAIIFLVVAVISIYLLATGKISV